MRLRIGDGGGQGGVLAQRMAGYHIRHANIQALISNVSVQEHRQLRVLRLFELFLCTVEHDLRDGVAQDLVRTAEELFRQHVPLAQPKSHPGML